LKKFRIALLLLLISCGSIESTYTIETINGVQYIRNHTPKWGFELEIELEFVQKIGELEEKDENYWLHRPMDVVIDNSENIYILDAGNYRIQKYSPSGEYITSMGRSGQGPGEFQTALSMEIDNSGILYVYDTGNRRVQRFSTDGGEQGSFRPLTNINPMRHFSTNELAGKCNDGFMSLYEYDPELISLISVYSNEDGRLIRKIGSPLDLKDPMITNFVNRISFDVDDGDNVVVAFQHLNRIDKYAYDGRHIFSTNRPLSYDVPDKPGLIEAGSNRRMQYVPDVAHVTNGAAVDGKGRIWVLTADRDERKTPYSSGPDAEKNLFDFHIFDYDGIFLGILPIPVTSRYVRLRIFGDRMFLLDNVYDVCVMEYRIVEK
jgi:sugar lactone lactonase YvrE